MLGARNTMPVFQALSIPPRQSLCKSSRLTSFVLRLIIVIAAIGWLPFLHSPAYAQSAVTRINAGGGSYTGPDGRVWSADTAFSGGGTYATGATIAGTSDQMLYRSEHYGNF